MQAARIYILFITFKQSTNEMILREMEQTLE